MAAEADFTGFAAGSTLVVKYGGAAMGEEHLEELFAADAAKLSNAGVTLVIVHGGGHETTVLAARLGIEAEFVNGHRRTDEAMLEVATMTLAGRINKNLVRQINMAGGNAMGLCGVDGNLLVARKLQDEIDLGYVGEVTEVNVKLLELLAANGMIPVIAPIGIGREGELFNINADLAAGAVAAALGADALIYMSNIEGIEVDGRVAPSMTRDTARELIESGVIRGGMIPKVRSAFAALDGGARSVRIIDGRVPHGLMMAVRSGTEVRAGDEG